MIGKNEIEWVKLSLLKLIKIEKMFWNKKQLSAKLQWWELRRNGGYEKIRSLTHDEVGEEIGNRK